MSTPVLYDVQGPRARRRVLISSVVGVLVLLLLLGVARVALEAGLVDEQEAEHRIAGEAPRQRLPLHFEMDGPDLLAAAFDRHDRADRSGRRRWNSACATLPRRSSAVRR